MGKFNFLAALFTGNQNVALIEIEDLLRKLKSNLKNSSDVSTKGRCYAFWKFWENSDTDKNVQYEASSPVGSLLLFQWAASEKPHSCPTGFVRN